MIRLIVEIKEVTDKSAQISLNSDSINATETEKNLAGEIAPALSVALEASLKIYAPTATIVKVDCNCPDCQVERASTSHAE